MLTLLRRFVLQCSIEHRFLEVPPSNISLPVGWISYIRLKPMLIASKTQCLVSVTRCPCEDKHHMWTLNIDHSFLTDLIYKDMRLSFQSVVRNANDLVLFDFTRLLITLPTYEMAGLRCE